jgi:hypothetical protein
LHNYAQTLGSPDIDGNEHQVTQGARGDGTTAPARRT